MSYNTQNQRIATSAILVKIAAGGSDVASTTRPQFLFGGDYTATPFASFAGVQKALPSDLSTFDHSVTTDGSTLAGPNFHGFTGTGTLDIQGLMAAVTPTTGVQSGTAGTGTSSTSIKKPTAAANWTASDSNLVGALVRITGGGGYYTSTVANIRTNGDPCYRRIKAVATDTLSIDALPGLDNTTTFDIVRPTSNLTSAGTFLGTTASVIFTGNDVDIQIRDFKFSSATKDVIVNRCASVAMRGLDVHNGHQTANTSTISVGCCDYGYDASSYRADQLFIKRCTWNSGLVTVTSPEVTVQMTARGDNVTGLGASAALNIKNSGFVSLGFDANAFTVSPLQLSNVAHLVSAGLTGTNGSAPFGMVIQGGGQYTVTGATLTGAADVQLEGITQTYSQLSAIGVATAFGTTLYWNGGVTVLRGSLSVDGDFSSGGFLKLYGKLFILDNGQPFDNAFLQTITAHAGGGTASAFELGFCINRVTVAASAGDSVRIRPVEAPGVLGFLINDSSNSINLYPPGGGTINGGSADVPVAVPAGSWAIFVSLLNYPSYVFSVRVF